MSNELNTGADWEQSKRLVVHWHNRWEKIKAELDKARAELEFTKQYLNPADTSFRDMMDTFHELSSDQKDKLIDLSRSLARLAAPPHPTEEK